MMYNCKNRLAHVDGYKYNKKTESSVKICIYALALTFVFGFLCNDRYFNVGNYFILPIVTILMCLISIFCNTIKTYKIKKLKIEHYCCIFILLQVIIVTYFLKYPFKFDTVMSYCMLFLLFFVVTLLRLNKRELTIIIKSYIMSALILSIILIVQRKMPYPGVLRFSVFYSSKDFYDVNFLAGYIFFPALLTFNNAIILTKKLSKIKYYIITIILLLAILLTGSRGGLIGFLIGATYILCINKKVKISTVICIILACIIMYYMVPKELTDRFFRESYNDGSNQKRLIHWKYGIGIFLKNPILGSGMVWPADIIWKEYGKYYAAHNTIIGILLQFGILGFINITIIFINSIIVLWKNNQKSISGMVFSLAFVLIMIEAQSSLAMFFPLIILYCIIDYIRRNNLEKFKF